MMLTYYKTPFAVHSEVYYGACWLVKNSKVSLLQGADRAFMSAYVLAALELSFSTRS